MSVQNGFTIEIGDRVTWTSQSNGTTSSKIGHVVQNAEEALRRLPTMSKIARNPMQAAQAIFPEHRLMFDGFHWPDGRFIVEVHPLAGKGKRLLYMPRSGGLQIIVDDQAN